MIYYRTCPRLMLDLSGVTFMDSSGIAVLLRALARNNALKSVRPKKNAAPSAANTEDGKAEKVLTGSDSAS